MKDNVLIKSYLISTADHLTHSNSSFPWVIRCKVRTCKIDTLSFTKKKLVSISNVMFFNSMHNPFCNETLQFSPRVGGLPIDICLDCRALLWYVES